MGVSSAKTKAMCITGFAKMVKHCPDLKQKVLSVLKKYNGYWDEDIQQRAVEYEILINGEGQINELFEEAFSELPTYPEKMQTNSVLMRRMSEVKSLKGFAVGKTEEGQEGKLEQTTFKVGVSSALSSNQPKKEDVPDSMGDLIGTDSIDLGSAP